MTAKAATPTGGKKQRAGRDPGLNLQAAISAAASPELALAA